MLYHTQNGTFQFTEDTFIRYARNIGEIYHEVFLIMKF